MKTILGLVLAFVLALASPAAAQWQSITVNSILPAVPTQAITLGSPNNPTGISIDPVTGLATLTSPILASPSVSGSLTGFTAMSGSTLTLGSASLQVLGNDFVITTAPTTVATAGPGRGASTFRLRQGTPGFCRLVIAGGNGLVEVTIPTLNFLGQPQAQFPGGPGGC